MPESPGVLLGIDFGTRKVGVAVGNRLTGSARPLDSIFYSKPGQLEERLDALIGQWRARQIVIGLPLSGDGSETEMSRQARALAGQLGERWPEVDISLHDERLSSHAAAERFAGMRASGQARRRDSSRLDSIAAALILESWMTEHA